MDKEQMLINAAKAMGFKPSNCNIKNGSSYMSNDGILRVNWNPLESSADCAEMEDALNICTCWLLLDERITCFTGEVEPEHSTTANFKDHANKGAARRYASTMVASLIGEKL